MAGCVWLETNNSKEYQMSRNLNIKGKSAPWIAVLALILLSGPAFAQDSDGLYAWSAPSAADQLAADDTVVPGGQGAIFVPSFSDGADEPDVLVFKEGMEAKKIASGKTGERIVVSPGSYVVKVGSGTDAQKVSTTVNVAAGETVSVDPTWAGLRILVVDTQNIPFRSTYEVINAESREVIGTGYGADTLQGESVRTWLLEPGLYRIVRSGETFRARRDFATVFLQPSALAHFKLVIDPDTNEFRGAGVITPDEAGVKTAESDSNWVHNVTASGAFSLSDTSNVVGQANQSTSAGTVFLDAYSTYENGPHRVVNIFELEEGFLQVNPDSGRKLPTQQIQDRLRADTLYTRYTHERWGPYGRFGLLTNVFEAQTLATEPITIAYNRLNGARDVVQLDANDQYSTADAFGSLRLREGVGINWRLLRSDRGTINVRAGLGLRQNLFNNAFVENDDPSTPALDLYEIDDFNQEGIETTLLATARLSSRLSYLTDLEVFADVDDTGDPTIDWSNTLSMRLSRYLSLDYTYNLLDFPQVSNDTQIRQSLLLRVSFDLL
jgi:hypothetical protein